MAAITSFLNTMLDTSFTGTITMGLFKTGLPSSTGVEISGGSYARQTLTMGAASGGVIAATAVATFSDLPTGTSNTIVAWGVYQGGTLIDEGTLSSPFTPDIDNNEFKISYDFTLST